MKSRKNRGLQVICKPVFIGLKETNQKINETESLLQKFIEAFQIV